MNGQDQSVGLRPVHVSAGKAQRKFAWALRGLVVACLALGTCVVRSSEPGQSAPKQAAYGSRGSAATVPADELEFIPGEGSAVELRGTSTIGAWTTRSTEIHGQVILRTDEQLLEAFFDTIEKPLTNDSRQAAAVLPELSFRGPATAEISVPVISLHGESGGMDKDIQKALRSGEDPSIVYVLDHRQENVAQNDRAGSQGQLNLRLTGNLSMAGTKRAVTMDVTVKRVSPAHFIVHAQAVLLMSDFGVRPPVALFGLIKGGNRVVAIFDLKLVTLSRKPPGS